MKPAKINQGLQGLADKLQKVWYIPLPSRRNYFQLSLILLLSVYVFSPNTVESAYASMPQSIKDTTLLIKEEVVIRTDSKPRMMLAKKYQLENVKTVQNAQIKTKNGIEKLTPSTLHTEWDRFRFAVYQVACSLKKEHDLKVSEITIYDWCMKLLFHESRYNANIRNSIDAQGLFQAIPSTRKWLKCGRLVGKHWSYQIKYFHKYLYQSLKSIDTDRIDSFGDWYFIGLYPAMADAPDHVVFGSKWGTKTQRANYRCNKGLDSNKDGIIYKGEVEETVLKRIK